MAYSFWWKCWWWTGGTGNGRCGVAIIAHCIGALMCAGIARVNCAAVAVKTVTVRCTLDLRYNGVGTGTGSARYKLPHTLRKRKEPLRQSWARYNRWISGGTWDGLAWGTRFGSVWNEASMVVSFFQLSMLFLSSSSQLPPKVIPTAADPPPHTWQ